MGFTDEVENMEYDLPSLSQLEHCYARIVL